MSRIKSKNTEPEMYVRKALSSLGIKYRLHRDTLPGKPDIAIGRIKTVIFVNGCFWHQHKCKRGTMPKSNKAYWAPKLERNIHRQKQIVEELKRLGWKIVVIWECQTLQIDKIKAIIKRQILNDHSKIQKKIQNY